MSKLILVKHSLPQIDPAVSAARWFLAPEGQRRSRLLAQQLAAYQPAHICSSPEPKAYETTQLVAQTFNAQVDVVDGLEEHHRIST
ncbi:MAG: histidine phosphatase family protein [Chloroflexi bacterium AL-W]|nr:histidine phosphatase family protein [Chloroflexi bacterium AL-N1]NOK65149.1 histidine phosphatase family protein [Chloroflexi bacterium AL-N10]NOK72585.1 histidine phosphatase family protein [Chloroflexi bacterium AL-N5]NOK79328.1 histidine phosphatase family protein [Chloroflexi bacterium AL-W]NOK87244.1 histidine phosphatase family protein [Chloroflexi bacterium AL-N15]